MKFRNNKNLYILLLLIISLVGIGLGYAHLSAKLNIKGITGINNVQWDIYFDNIQVVDGSIEAAVPAVIDDTKTSVSYGIILEKPGDFYEFTVDAVNNGSLDGMIEAISFKLNDVEITKLPDYLEYEVSYSSGKELEVNHLLKAFNKETYRVRVVFKDDITADQLPSEKQNLDFNFGVTYKQADDNGVEVVHQFTRYTVNIYDENDKENTQVFINQPISEKIVQYKTPNDARANFENRPMYLKHVIKDGKVKESYVEFVITEEMAAANEGMTAGTYALKGADSGVAFEANKDVLNSAFGANQCESMVIATSNTSVYRCFVSNYKVGTDDDGSPFVIVDSYGCKLNDDGSSDCGMFS